MPRSRINVGLIGAGRLGSIYARHLASTIPEFRLTSVADIDRRRLDAVTDEIDGVRTFECASDLLDSRPDAVVIATPTSTHCEIVCLAARAGVAAFCEKPISIDLAEACEAKGVVEESGIFFQMGFMRRFDRGYAAAKRKLEEGFVGRPVLFKSTSRDPFAPPVEYADPVKSGGLILDMGIHDFDLARWLMGEVESVTARGTALAYPELAAVGDIDNAVVTLSFENGGLGLIDLSRNGVYGYDIATEILGTEGTLRVGYLRETPLQMLSKNRVAHDVVPFFPERFAEAFVLQLQNFGRNLLDGTPPPITLDDGIAALQIGCAATRAQKSGETVSL